jgi:type IV secretory pathway VirB10-like protein
VKETDKVDANPSDILKQDLGPEGGEAEVSGDKREESSLRGRLRNLLAGAQRGRKAPPLDPKQDRTRALVLLIGGIVGSILLFVGVFSTPPSRSGQERSVRPEPNLGRKDETAARPRASSTPLLNAQVEPGETGSNRLSAVDIQNTSQRDLANEHAMESPSDRPLKVVERPSPPPRTPAYRPIDPPPITFRYGATPDGTDLAGLEPVAPYPGDRTPKPDLLAPTIKSPTAKSSIVSSIVFVRSETGTARSSELRSTAPNDSVSALLPSGSRLIARLESAVTSALKAPVVAAVEYNYEKDGVILIPAGTKVIGDMNQASSNGYVGIAFHSLQMPGGRAEQIAAIAMDLENKPLKGNVTGTNKGRKLLTRTLSGVGTIAAYVVGAGGSSLGQPITGGTLLRDRLAGNIASAGEQELTNAAFSQNLEVTVPAQTRFYVVLQKAAVERVDTAMSPLATGRDAPMPSVQELRELMDLRRELSRMYAESAVQMPVVKP